MKSQGSGGRDRRITEILWPARLAYLASFRSVRETVSKIKVDITQRTISRADL